MKLNVKKLFLCILFIIILMFGTYKIWDSVEEQKKGYTMYEELKEHIETDEGSENAYSDIVWPTVDFISLKKINNNIVAWIYIEHLNINYPVVQGQDNNYYLNHLIDGSYNTMGSIFLDYRNQADLENRNTIIYGHYTSTDSMFTRLGEYKEQSHLDQYPYYLIVTPNKKYRVDIFSVYIANPDEDAWKISFSSTEEFNSWLRTTKSKSLVQNNVTPTINDNIITLSTCNQNSSNERFVLVGVASEYIKE